MTEKSDWEKRFREAETAFHTLKQFTKKVRLDGQTPEYKQLADLIHSLGRDVFYVNSSDFNDH